MTVGDYKDQDDFILVRRFMSTELGIQSKNEMLLYALIYSYSDGGSAFYGSTEYLAKRLGSSKSRIIKVLNEMVSKGLIIKKTSGRFNFYVTNYNYVCNTDEQKVSVQNTERCHIDTESSVTPTPNNINNNINNNNYLKCVSNMSKKGKSYILLGEFKNVKLTEEELKKVVENYQWYFEDAIEALSSYLEFKGDKYKSHYAVLGKTNWVWRKVHDNQDCGIRPVCNMIPDPTQVGGLRKETAWEYYSKKYGWDF